MSSSGKVHTINDITSPPPLSADSEETASVHLTAFEVLQVKGAAKLEVYQWHYSVQLEMSTHVYQFASPRGGRYYAYVNHPMYCLYLGIVDLILTLIFF